MAATSSLDKLLDQCTEKGWTVNISGGALHITRLPGTKKTGSDSQDLFSASLMSGGWATSASGKTPEEALKEAMKTVDPNWPEPGKGPK